MRIPCLALLLVFVGCASPRVLPDAPEQVGRRLQTLVVGGRTRRYELLRPPRPEPGWRYPVLFAFHGAGSSVDSLARAGGFDDRATRDGFLVVYPEGIGRRFDTSRGSRDVAFTRALLAHLDRSVGIDRARIHAIGFSNGGFLCYRLAADLPGVFAGIVPVGGLLARDALPAGPTTTSLLHVHGSADRVVRAGGRPGTLGALEGVAQWGSRLGCRGPAHTAPAADSAPLRVRITTHACPAGRSARLLWLEGIGHAWPQDGDQWLNRQIWSFLRTIRSSD